VAWAWRPCGNVVAVDEVVVIGMALSLYRPGSASHPWLRTATAQGQGAGNFSRLPVLRIAMTWPRRKTCPARVAAAEVERTSARSRKRGANGNPGCPGARRLWVRRLGGSDRSARHGSALERVDAGFSERRSMGRPFADAALQTVCADYYWWLHPLTTPQVLVKNRTRLDQEGVSDRRRARGEVFVDPRCSRNGAQTLCRAPRRLDGPARVPNEGSSPRTRPCWPRRSG